MSDPVLCGTGAVCEQIERNLVEDDPAVVRDGDGALLVNLPARGGVQRVDRSGVAQAQQRRSYVGEARQRADEIRVSDAPESERDVVRDDFLALVVPCLAPHGGADRRRKTGFGSGGIAPQEQRMTVLSDGALHVLKANGDVRAAREQDSAAQGVARLPWLRVQPKRICEALGIATMDKDRRFGSRIVREKFAESRAGDGRRSGAVVGRAGADAPLEVKRAERRGAFAARQPQKRRVAVVEVAAHERTEPGALRNQEHFRRERVRVLPAPAAALRRALALDVAPVGTVGPVLPVAER